MHLQLSLLKHKQPIVLLEIILMVKNPASNASRVKQQALEELSGAQLDGTTNMLSLDLLQHIQESKLVLLCQQSFN